VHMCHAPTNHPPTHDCGLPAALPDNCCHISAPPRQTVSCANASNRTPAAPAISTPSLLYGSADVLPGHRLLLMLLLLLLLLGTANFHKTPSA